MIFIENIKYLRSVKGLSQAQFAEACNVSTGTIGNIECGLAKPSFDLLLTMANILDTSPSRLFESFGDTEDLKLNNPIEEHKLLVDIFEKLKTHFEL